MNASQAPGGETVLIRLDRIVYLAKCDGAVLIRPLQGQSPPELAVTVVFRLCLGDEVVLIRYLAEPILLELVRRW